MEHLRIALCALVLSFAATASADDPPAHAYTLRARLDPALHTIAGQGTIRWTNQSTRPQRELWIHLYLNAFAHRRTIFMRESGGQLRGVRFDGQGGIRVTRLRWGDDDLLEGAGPPDAPSDGSTPPEDEDEAAGAGERDETEWRVPLPRAVAPGESIELEVIFESRLPPVFARSGYAGDFHVVAQWFPKIARLERDGTWASFPYHGNGEFYADFADYELTVETPPGWQVGATGQLRSHDEGPGRTSRTFVAENVHDQVFVAAPWLQELAEPVPAGPDGREIAVRVLYPPGYESAAERHLEVTRRGLVHFGEMLFPYPYEQLTVVVPPRAASGAAGMEYPQLFLTAGEWFRWDSMPMAWHDEVTAHELGHQWFQGMVATHEVRWPMLDEGLTEWVTGDLMREMHGRRRSGIGWPFDVDGFEIRRGVALLGDATPPPGTPAYGFPDGGYGRTIYFRTSSVLETVARTWGRDRFRRALGSYARANRFGHPTPEDLFRAFDAEYGRWMSQRVLRPALMEGASYQRSAGPLTHEGGRTRVTFTRAGELPIPTRVRLSGPAGETEVPWPARQRELAIDVEGHYDLAQADPRRHGLVDADRRDDVATTRDRRGLSVQGIWRLLATLFGSAGP